MSDSGRCFSFYQEVMIQVQKPSRSKLRGEQVPQVAASKTLITPPETNSKHPWK